MYKVDLYNEPEPEEEGSVKFHQAKKAALVLLVGLLGAAALVFFTSTPPKIAAQKVSIPVNIISVSPSTARTVVKGFGTVAPQREIAIRPQVNGTVVAHHEAFQAGGRIQKGDVLFEIDPRDYEIAVEEQKALLARAQFELKLEQGNQVVAQREWKLLKRTGSNSALAEELALRKPHLREKQAAVMAAESRLKRAELDLERATVIAPYPTLVIEEDIEIGRFVNSQEIVARIVDVESFDVEVQLSQSDLKWLPQLVQGSSVSKEALPLEATVIQRQEDGLTFERSASVVRLLGDVDQGGRMAKVLIRITTPLEVNSESAVPLLLGSYVEVKIQGAAVSDVYQLPRKAIREGGVIWIVSPENTLDIIDIEEVFSTTQDVYIRGELPPQMQVITNQISSGLKGMLVTVLDNDQLENSRE